MDSRRIPRAVDLSEKDTSMLAWSLYDQVCRDPQEESIESKQGSTDNLAKQVGHITKDADALASHKRFLNAQCSMLRYSFRFACTFGLHIAVLTSNMSLMRSWADCFLLRVVPPDSVRSRVLMRGEDGSNSGGALAEDDDARPAIVHIKNYVPHSYMVKHRREGWRQCALK